MLEIIRPTFDFGLVYAEKLVADIPDDQLTGQPVPGRVMNHAAFTLGHLAWAHDNMLSILGQQPTKSAWKELFGMGSKPRADRSAYPSKAELLAALKECSANLIAAVDKASPELLAKPAPERMARMFPTVGAMLAGLMTAHFGNHLGQMSAWRPAMGFPSVF